MIREESVPLVKIAIIIIMGITNTPKIISIIVTSSSSLGKEPVKRDSGWSSRWMDLPAGQIVTIRIRIHLSISII